MRMERNRATSAGAEWCPTSPFRIPTYELDSPTSPGDDQRRWQPGPGVEPWPHTRFDRPTADSLVVTIVGDFDAVSAPHVSNLLGPRLSTPGLRMLVLDLSQLSFLASAGLQVLVKTSTQADPRGIKVRLVMGPRNVTRALEVTGLDREFVCCPDLDTALNC